MPYKREEIHGTSPLDIKKINDNIKILWLKLFGNIDNTDFAPNVGSKIDISNNASVTSVVSKINGVEAKSIEDIAVQANRITEQTNRIDAQAELIDQKEAAINTRIDDLDTDLSSQIAGTLLITQNNKKELSDRIDVTVSDINTLETKTDGISSDLSSYKVSNDSVVATKLSNESFSSYQVQTANEIASKVSNTDFNSYKVQTAELIGTKVDSGTYSSFVSQTATDLSSKVSNSDFTTYQTQTSSAIASKVDSGTFDTYKVQTAELIGSKVSNNTFSSYQLQTANEISSKVSHESFTTYQTQTAELIGSKVSDGDFESYKTQTSSDISSKVASSDFESYKTQTASAISSKVEGSTFTTYQTQTDKDLSLVVTRSGSTSTIKADDIVSAINVSPGTVNIAGNKVDVTGFVTFTDLSTLGKTTIEGGNVTTNNLKVSKLVATDGVNKVIISGGGDVQISSILYGINSQGAIGLGLFPQASLIKTGGIQAMQDNNTYSTPNVYTMALGKINKLTSVDAVIDTNLQAGNGGSGSGAIIVGYLTVTGSKNSLQNTDNYDQRLINAYETAEYYFGDIGYGTIGEDGECAIAVDEIFQECINMNIPYHVFTQTYNGRIISIDRQVGYFVIRGEIGTEFSWEVKAKRKGYEVNRLEPFDTGYNDNYSDIEHELDNISNLENDLLEVVQ